MAVDLSLIMPAYKQEKTIVKDIKEIDKVLSTLKLKYEIIVVVDGFVDKTFQKAKRIKKRKVKVIGYEKNLGKGFAIKTGVEKANGDIIGFIDAGMDLDPREIKYMLDIMSWKNADIVVGSKLHPDSVVNYPISRKVISWCYRLVTRSLFNLNIKDTQVGLKIFKYKVAKKVFPKIVVKAFAFDIEVLAVAHSFGYKKIYEAPIRLRFRQGSITNTNFWKVGFWTLVDTMAIFYRMHIINYYKKNG